MPTHLGVGTAGGLTVPSAFIPFTEKLPTIRFAQTSNDPWTQKATTPHVQMAAPTTLTFRRATVEDVPALEPLINAAFRDDQTTQVFLSTDHETIDVVSEEVLLAKIARPDTAVLVGRLGAEGQIVGHCSIRLMEDGVTAWLSLLAVDVTRKNQGLGSQVLAHAEEYCHQTLGARRIEFDVVNTRVDLIAW